MCIRDSLVAIDESRQPFAPTLIKAGEGRHEIWFAGGHGDIGGGHKDRATAEMTLGYMMKVAELMSLRFLDGSVSGVEELAEYDGAIHISNDKFDPHQRSIVVRFGKGESVLLPKIHESVFERDSTYRPSNLNGMGENEYEVVKKLFDFRYCE